MTRHTGERGQILPLIAICLVALMGFAGIAVDVGYLQYQQHQQQSAADAGALAGAQELLLGGAIQTAAQKDASKGGFTDGVNSVKVTAYNPPQSGSFKTDGSAVQVTVYSPQRTFFGRLFGLTGDETTQATAILANNSNGCIYLLSSTSASTITGGSINAPNCGMLINDTANLTGANISVASIGEVNVTAPVGGSVNPAPVPMLPVADPCPGIAGCAYLAAHAPATSGCTAASATGSHLAITPGCYSSITATGATVTMAPGLYVFNGSAGNFSFTGATLNGSGVTIYVPNGSAPTFTGASTSLSAPTTGNYAGVLYYQVPSNAHAPQFTGASNAVSGLIYAPGALNVGFTGGSGGYAVLVFGSVDLTGSSTNDFSGPPTGGSLIQQAVLAE